MVCSALLFTVIPETLASQFVETGDGTEVLALAVLLILGSVTMGKLALQDPAILIKDLGLAAISLFGMIIAVYLGVTVVHRELEQKTVYFIIPKPLHRTEFLLGKQLPYVALAMLSYLVLLLQALLLFGLPMQGSLAALTFGALLFVFASTGLGLLMSTFMRTQIGAVFATAIASTIPTILFSGMLVPVSALTGPARIMGYGFPSAWFNHISVGAFR